MMNAKLAFNAQKILIEKISSRLNIIVRKFSNVFVLCHFCNLKAFSSDIFLNKLIVVLLL